MLAYGKPITRRRQFRPTLVVIGIGMLFLTAGLIWLAPSTMELATAIIGLVCCELGLPDRP